MKKKIFILALISLFAVTTAYATDFIRGPLADASLYGNSSGAFGDTSAVEIMETIYVKVAVEYRDGSTSRTATDSGSRTQYDYVSASVTVPGDPIKAEGTHRYHHYHEGHWTGSTTVNY